MLFAVRVDLSLGDDEMLVLPAIFRRLDIMHANVSMYDYQ